MSKVNYYIEASIVTTITVILFYFFSSFSLNIDFLDPIENTISDIELTDLYFNIFKDNRKDIDTNIVLVNFGDMNRLEIANTVKIINKYSPKVIGIDAFFSKPSILRVDDVVDTIFSNTKNLVLVSLLHSKEPDSFTDTSTTVIPPYFNNNISHGYANLKEDRAYRTIRNYRPTIQIGNKKYPSFAARIVQLYSTELYDNLLNLGNSEEVINYIGKRNKFYNISAEKILKEQQKFNFLKNKIVLLGYIGNKNSVINQNDNEDKFYTPLNKKYIGRGRPDMYGVVIHANIISMIIRNDYITNFNNLGKKILMLVLFYVNSLIFLVLYYHNHDLYSSLSKVVIIFESFILMFLSFLLLNSFYLKVELKPIFIGLVFLPDILESYIGIIKKIKEKKWKRKKMN